jgi:tetratricopeptide (TPR) repeat protein
MRRNKQLVAAVAMAFTLALTGCDSDEKRVEQHHENGLQLLAEGAPEKAALEFQNALQVNQDFVPARFEFAKILLARGEFQRAVGHLLKVVALDPAHAKARLELSKIFLLAGQFDEALTHADIAHKAAPDVPDALTARAVAHYRLGHAEQALDDVNRALALRPNDPQAGLLLVTERFDAGDRKTALTLADRFLEHNPADLPLNLAKARMLSQAGDDAALGAHLEHLTELHPDNLNLRQLLANWYLRKGDRAGVERELRTISALQPDNLPALENLLRFLIREQGEDVARTEIVARIDAAVERGASPFPFQLLLADFDFQLGRADDAKALLVRVIASPPDDDGANKARLQLARIELSAKEFDSAKQLIDAVIAIDAKNAQALALRAAILTDEGDMETAVLDLRAALNEAPDDVGLLRLASKVYQRSGNPELAGESLSSAVRLSNADPDIVLEYVAFLKLTGQGRLIEAVLADAVQRRPDDAQLLTGLGAVYVEAKNWSEATNVLKQLRSVDAGAGGGLEAAILAGRGETEEAVALLTRIGEAAGTNTVAAAIVRVYLQTGQRAAANGFLDDLLEQDPKNAEALLLKGAASRFGGDADKALEYFRAAIAADPKNPAAYTAVASVYNSAGRPAEAEAAITEGLAAIPNNPVLTLHSGNLLERKGDYEGALAAYEALFTQRPNSLIAANNLASTLSEHYADDPEKLARAGEVARRLAGVRDPALQDTYGWILYLQGKPADALRSLIPAAEGLPNNPWVRYHVGMAYAALNRTEEAKGHLDAALKLAEGQAFPPATKVRAELDRIGTAQ